MRLAGSRIEYEVDMESLSLFKSRRLGVLLAVFSLVVFTACGGDSKDDGLAAQQVLRLNMGAEPGTIDPALASISTETSIIRQLASGLFTYDENLNIVPALAKALPTAENGGISADGQHGFTFGFMTLHRPDGTTVPIKYLSYWIKSRDGWRVAGYKRRPRPAGDVSTTPMAPALPALLIAPITDAAAIAKHRASLEEAERAFSRDAQTMGIGPAFEQYGSADAMNTGGPEDAGFVIGSATIGRNVGAGSPPNTSPVVWGPDHNAFVASSGDLGVTFGYIRAKANGPDGKPPAPSPFFTVWRRASATAPWKYVAE